MLKEGDAHRFEPLKDLTIELLQGEKDHLFREMQAGAGGRQQKFDCHVSLSRPAESLQETEVPQSQIEPRTDAENSLSYP